MKRTGAVNRDELDKLVLMEVKRQCDLVRDRPRPPAWQKWTVRLHELDLEHGPLYTPAWFADLAATNAGRVRLLRIIHKLAAADLLDAFRSAGGRLERVRVTAKGLRAVRSLQKARK
jgi:hypothetical protein